MAINQAKLHDNLERFSESITFKNKKHTFEETRRFWTDMTSDNDKLTAYIIALICRVITLDTIPSDTTLPDIYESLILKCDNKTNYDNWTAALLKEKEKDKKYKTTVHQPDSKEIVQLRTKLLLTLNFIVNFYPDYNIGQIATLISRWKLARESYRLLEFEQNTLALWGDLDKLDMPKILRKGSSGDKNKLKGGSSNQISILIKQCIAKMKRGMGGQFPEFTPSICETGPVSDSLCYLKLISILEQHPVNYVSALSLILQSLTDIQEEQSRPVTSSQQPPKPEDKERLLPYLQLFRELVTRAPSINYTLLDQAYKTVYSFFLWPVPYCHFAREILNFIDAERICPGFSYRNRILSEHNIQVKDSTINSSEKIHLLIDYAAPQALSLREVFKKTEANENAVKMHLLMRAFLAVKGVNVDLDKLERILKAAGSETLDMWLSEYINNSHKVLYDGLIESQEILDKHLTVILEKMVAFFNEKNPEEKIDNLNDIIENPNQTLLKGFGLEALPQTPITVRFLNSLMEPKSPEDIIDEILTEGTKKVGTSARHKLDRNRPHSVISPMGMSTSNSFISEDSSAGIIRTGSSGTIEVTPMRHMTVSEKVKQFQIRKRNESQSQKESTDEENLVQEPEADDELGQDDVIFVDIFGNISSAKQSNLPRTKRGILTQELREGRTVLKLVIAGDDKSVAMVMKTYLHVKLKHNMSDTDVQFYYIPLSSAETVSGGEGQLFVGSLDMGELQDPLTMYFYENQPSRGGDIWMGRLLGHLDGWYENFVTLPIHCALQLCPQSSINVDDSGDVDKKKFRRRDPKSFVLPHSPVRIIRDTIVNFTREATQLLTIHNYYVDMTDSRGTHIDSVMCHRLELITRELTQKSTQVGTIPKPPSIRLTLHAIQLDGTPYPLIEVPYQRYFVLKASNVPKPGDFWAANPAEVGFEVHAVVGEKVGGGGLTSKSRYGPSDQRYNWYVKQVVIEAQEKDTFHVSIDKENPHGNIHQLVIRPTRSKCMETAPQFLDDLSVPFMTYWPVDL